MTNLTTGVVMEFTYNHAGIRTKKVKKENGVAVETTEYILNGKQVVGLIHTDPATNTTEEMQFFYDAQGRVSMLKYGSALYSYVHNLQGDVVAIIGGNGETIDEYTYDSWGKPTNVIMCEIGEITPFKYRSYLYDNETDFYYLHTRFYCCKCDRFVNADGKLTNDHLMPNLFSYCANKPTLRIDESGKDYSVIGAGVQIDISAALGPLSIGGGIEAIVYWGVEEAKDDGYTVAVYCYGDGAIAYDNYYDDIKSVVQILAESADYLRMEGGEAVSGILNAFDLQCSCSVSGLLITGDETFTTIEDYTGRFDTYTVNIWKVKGNYSWSDKCKTYGIGYSFGSAGFGISRSVSEYSIIYSSDW